VRNFILGATFLLIASAAFAQDQQTAARPDYSRDALLRFAANNEIKMSPLPDHLPPSRIQWHFGWMEFRGLGMEWRIFYLPIVVPLAGSGMQSVAKLPNALELTGTPFASCPEIFRDRPASVNREVKRVLKLERQAKVKVEKTD
jgi:hypothetical protein